MMILDDGGGRLTPLFRSVIQLYGMEFWIWKFAIVSISLNFIMPSQQIQIGYTRYIGDSLPSSIIFILYQFSCILLKEG